MVKIHFIYPCLRTNFNDIYLHVALADVYNHFLEGVDIDSLQLLVAGLLELFNLPPVLLRDYQLLHLGGGKAAPAAAH